MNGLVFDPAYATDAALHGVPVAPTHVTPHHEKSPSRTRGLTTGIVMFRFTHRLRRASRSKLVGLSVKES